MCAHGASKEQDETEMAYLGKMIKVQKRRITDEER
jgi:hypothetical protein